MATQWAFTGTDSLELIIIQPPHIRRWVTDFKTLDDFERELFKAVKLSSEADAPYQVGDHCRWCAAKPICPKMTGAADRALRIKLDELPAEDIGKLLKQADLVEEWIKDLRELAFTCLENDKPISLWRWKLDEASSRESIRKAVEMFKGRLYLQ